MKPTLIAKYETTLAAESDIANLIQDGKSPQTGSIFMIVADNSLNMVIGYDENTNEPIIIKLNGSSGGVTPNLVLGTDTKTLPSSADVPDNTLIEKVDVLNYPDVAGLIAAGYTHGIFNFIFSGKIELKGGEVADDGTIYILINTESTDGEENYPEQINAQIINFGKTTAPGTDFVLFRTQLRAIFALNDIPTYNQLAVQNNLGLEVSFTTLVTQMISVEGINPLPFA